MQTSRGFSHVAVLSIIAILVIVGIGFLVIQSRQQGVTKTPSQINQSQQNPHDVKNWTEYRFEQYGLTFKHPQNWSIEVEVVAGHDDRPNILIKDNHGQKVLGIYGSKGSDDDCDIPAGDVEPQPDITIDGHRATVMKTCDHLENWIGARVKDDRFVSITTGFVGQPAEADARMLIETLTGIVGLPIIN